MLTCPIGVYPSTCFSVHRQIHNVYTYVSFLFQLAALGAFILLFGFFAFNGGSQKTVSKPGDSVIIATAIFNTVIAGTGGAISNLVLIKCYGVIHERRVGYKYTLDYNAILYVYIFYIFLFYTFIVFYYLCIYVFSISMSWIFIYFQYTTLCIITK